MKARNLRGVEISSSRKEGLVGDLSRKGTAYDLWTLDPAAVGGSGDQNDGAISPLDVQPGVGAEELNGLSVLLPCRRKGGQLYLGACVCAARIHPFWGRWVAGSLKRNNVFFFSFFQFKSPSRGILLSPHAPLNPQDQTLRMKRPSGRHTLMKCSRTASALTATLEICRSKTTWTWRW